MADRRLGTENYVLGHSREELIRLERQAGIFAAPTEDILRKAGIGPGMRVLDLGCGVGDVSMLAARLVGPTGSVLGIDRAEQALDLARARARDLSLDWATFERVDLKDMADPKPFDAIVGRFILMHLAEPAQIVGDLLKFLAPGGSIAFIEMDIGSADVVPDYKPFTRWLGVIAATYRAAGMEPDMGSKLYATLRAAGLNPEVAGSFRVEGGPTTSAHEYLAETLRSLMPAITRFNIASPADIGVDTLEERLRTGSMDGDYVFFFPRLIGAWGRKSR